MTTPWKQGRGIGFGTCGELVQGVLSDGRTFHVTCPIKKRSTVTMRYREGKEWQITGVPPERQKILSAIQSTADELGLGSLEAEVEHSSDLEVGKGLGSSTADIVAAARALADAAGGELSEEKLATIATSIEASDGSMYPQIVAFDHKSGALIRRFEWWPQMAVAIVTPTATLDTVSADFTGQAVLGPRFDHIVAGLDHAVLARDGRAFAEAAMASAAFNQQFVPNPWFEMLIGQRESLEADGVNVAHTGTCLGVLFVLPEESDGATGPSARAVLQSASNAVRRLRSMLPGTVRVDLSVTPVCRPGETVELNGA